MAMANESMSTTLLRWLQLWRQRPRRTPVLTRLSVVVAVCCFLSRHADALRGGTTEDDLHPIHIDDFEIATGLAKRDEHSLHDFMIPGNQTHLAWGRPTDNETHMTGNMTLYAPYGSFLVSMERFESLTSVVDCHGDDGELSMTFISRESFDYALEHWSFINDDDDANFILITNHDGCGEAHRRQSYRITKVDSQEDMLRTIMASEPLDWDDVAGAFDLDFGDASFAESGSTQLRIRSPPLDKRAKSSKPSKWSFGSPDKTLHLFTDPTWYPPRLKLFCVKCYSKGSFRIAGALKLRGWNPLHLQMDIIFDEFTNVYDLEWQFTHEVDYFSKMEDKTFPEPKKDSFVIDTELFSIGIPGLSIPKLFTVGPSVGITFRSELQTFGRLNLDMGFKWDMPAGSKWSIYPADPLSSTFALPKGPRPIFEINSGNIEASMVGYMAPIVKLGVSLLDIYEMTAESFMRLPSLNANISFGSDEEKGFCKGSKKTTGIKFDSAANLQIWGKITMPNFKVIGKAIAGILSAIFGIEIPEIPDWNDLDRTLENALNKFRHTASEFINDVGDGIANGAKEVADAIIDIFDKRGDIPRIAATDGVEKDLEVDEIDDGEHEIDGDSEDDDDDDGLGPRVKMLQVRATPSPTGKKPQRGKHRGPVSNRPKPTNTSAGKHRTGPKHAKTGKPSPKHKATKGHTPSKHPTRTGPSHRKTGKPSPKHKAPKEKLTKQELKSKVRKGLKKQMPQLQKIWQDRFYNGPRLVGYSTCWPMGSEVKPTKSKQLPPKKTKSTTLTTSKKTTSAHTTSRKTRTPTPTSRSEATTHWTSRPTQTPAPDDDDYKTKGCEVTADALMHRPCPQADNKRCPAFGQYPKGKRVKFTCKVQGEKIKSTSYWGKTDDEHYLSLEYIEKSCAAHIPKCK